MRDGRPSLTAQFTTLARAAESAKPESKRLCYDPLAKEFLVAPWKVLASGPILSGLVAWWAERITPGALGELLGRTRYIDDSLKACIAEGIEQLVILGAGYDSRAYRFDELRQRVRIFEVDHPATQQVKMKQVTRLLGHLPNNVVFVPVDFEKERLEDKLFEKGYDRNSKTLYIWEGVTFFLTAKAVDETLAFVVHNSGEGSSIIFNYVLRSVVDGTNGLEAARRHQAVMTRLGEPYTFGIEEGKIEEFLSKRGFCQIRNASPEFLENTYFRGKTRGKKVCPYMSTVCATVRTRV